MSDSTTRYILKSVGIDLSTKFSTSPISFKKNTVAFRCLYLGIREHEANEVKNAINKGIYIDTSNMTMAEYLKLYLDTHAKPNFKPTSYDTEKTMYITSFSH